MVRNAACTESRVRDMCGIAGFQLARPADFDADRLLAGMERQQRHRGPDGNGLWTNAQRTVGLCHSRLAIVELSGLGSQPMHTQDGLLTVTFNGEIYNWRPLRQELESRGHVFRSHSDTEILLHGYRQWGLDLLQKLRGMFAFALWDEARQSLFCARDRIGKKPFVYAATDTAFYFASEIPALLSLGAAARMDLAIDKSAIAAMMLHNLRHIPEPATAYVGIRKLRAGHAMVISAGRLQRTWRYWDAPVCSDVTIAGLRAAIEDAVAIRSIADVPVGALLSGGVDSTAIVSLMQRQAGEPVRTYAFGLDADDEDIRRARLVSKRLGTRHREFYFDASRQFDVLRELMGTLGEPIMLLPLVHAHELSEAIRDDGIKVVMNGNGADELFFGYLGHLSTARVTRLMTLFGGARALLPSLADTPLGVFLARPGERKAAYYRYRAHREWPGLFKPEVRDCLVNIASEEMSYWGAVVPHHDFIDESNYISLLVDNSHSVSIAGDLPAMMASVEMRSPFLDQEIVAAAMGIHYTRKVRGPADGSRLKDCLRQAVADLVPPEVMHAAKRGFGAGIQEQDLFLGGWRSRAAALFDDFPDTGLFDVTAVRALWRSAVDGAPVQWSQLAKLFAIGLWMAEAA